MSEPDGGRHGFCDRLRQHLWNKRGFVAAASTAFVMVGCVNSDVAISSAPDSERGCPSACVTESTTERCLAVLASGLDRPREIVVDGTRAYWTTSDGKVMTVPREGGTATTLAIGRDTLGVAVDGSSGQTTS